MGNFYYENIGSKTYLVYGIPEEEAVDSTVFGMLMNNTVRGLVKPVFTQMDRSQFIKYDVSARVSLGQVLQMPIKKKTFLKLFSGILDAASNAKEYMIESDMLVLDTDYIFTSVADFSVEMVCLPLRKERDEKQNLEDFFRGILFRTRFDQTENCDYIAKIINYLNSDITFTPAGFKDLIKGLGNAKEDTLSAGTEKTQRLPVALERNCIVDVALPPQKEKVEEKGPADGYMCLKAEEKKKEKKQTKEEKKQAKKEERRAKKEEKQAEKERKQQEKAEKKAGKKKEKAVKQPAGHEFSFAIPGQEHLYEEKRVPKVSVKQELPPQSAAVQDVIAEKAPQGKEYYRTKPADFGDTEYLYDEGGSFVDDATEIRGSEGIARQITPHLVRKSNNERIPLNKPVFRLGRDVDFNDYAIVENRYVGHTHCHIVTEDGSYYVVDDNSKNHTRVDGQVIPSGQKIKIVHEDVIALDTEEFEFRLF